MANTVAVLSHVTPAKESLLVSRPARRTRPAHLGTGRTRVGLAAALAVSASALVGCSSFSPTTTELDYTAADGVNVTVGTVQARNLVVVGTKGAQGVVSGALVNTGTSAVTVAIETSDQSLAVRVDVPAGELVALGSAGSTRLSGSDAAQEAQAYVPLKVASAAGSLMPLTLSSPQAGRVDTRVPVLPAAGVFATVTPLPATSTASPTSPAATRTKGPKATSSPTSSPTSTP